MNNKDKLLHSISSLQKSLEAYHGEILIDNWVKTDSVGVPMIVTTINNFSSIIHQHSIEFQKER